MKILRSTRALMSVSDIGWNGGGGPNSDVGPIMKGIIRELLVTMSDMDPRHRELLGVELANIQSEKR